MASFDIYRIFALIPEPRGKWFGYNNLLTRIEVCRVTITGIPDCLKATILYNRKIIILEIYSLWWHLERPEAPLVHPMNWSNGYNLICLRLSTCILIVTLFFFLLFLNKIWKYCTYLWVQDYLLPISWRYDCYVTMQVLFIVYLL